MNSESATDRERLKQVYEQIALSGDERTTACDYNLRDLEIDFALQTIRDGDRVLDVGCGPGVALRSYAGNRQISAYGIDYAENMIEFARRRTDEIAPTLQIDFRHASVLELPFADGAFDVVTSSRCLMALLDWELQQQALVEIHRVLRPGGQLVLMEGTIDGLARLNFYRRKFNLPEIEPDGRDRLFTLKFHEKELTDFCTPYYEMQRTQRFGMYYFLTRIVQPLLVAPDQPRYDHRLNEVAKHIAAWCRTSKVSVTSSGMSFARGRRDRAPTDLPDIRYRPRRRSRNDAVSGGNPVSRACHVFLHPALSGARGYVHEVAPHPFLDAGTDWQQEFALRRQQFPDAVSWRSHACIFSHRIGARLNNSGYRYVSVFDELGVTGLQPNRLSWGLWHLPIYYMDSLELGRAQYQADPDSRPFDDRYIERATTIPGLYVFDFHPFHLFLNTRTLTSTRRRATNFALGRICRTSAMAATVQRAFLTRCASRCAAPGWRACGCARSSRAGKGSRGSRSRWRGVRRRHLALDPLHRSDTHPESLCGLQNAGALRQLCADALIRLLGDLRPAERLSFRSGPRQTSMNPLLDDVGLELREYADHAKHGLARRRGGIQRLLVQEQVDAGGLQLR